MSHIPVQYLSLAILVVGIFQLIAMTIKSTKHDITSTARNKNELKAIKSWRENSTERLKLRLKMQQEAQRVIDEGSVWEISTWEEDSKRHTVIKVKSEIKRKSEVKV